MNLPRWALLLSLLVFSTSCSVKALGPDAIRVSGEEKKDPYEMNGDYYTGEQLKNKLTEYVKQFPHRFSTADPGEEGLLVYADEKASFAVVMQLFQVLKESGVTTYRVEYNYRESPVSAVHLSLPMQSAQLLVRREQVQPPPPAEPAPQQRIKEITEKMSRHPRK